MPWGQLLVEEVLSRRLNASEGNLTINLHKSYSYNSMHLLQDTGSDTRGKKSARWRGGRMLCTLSKNQGECQCLEHRWKMVKTPAQVWKLIVNSLFGRCKQSPFGLAGWYLRRAWQPVFNGHVATKEARKPFGHSTGALFAVWTRRYEKQSRFDPIRSPCGLVLFDGCSWVMIVHIPPEELRNSADSVVREFGSWQHGYNVLL